MIARYLLGAMLLLSIISAYIPPTTGNISVTPDVVNQLVINVYTNQNGTDMSLIIGYISSPTGLPFLKSSERIYENDTGKIYALTNPLIT